MNRSTFLRGSRMRLQPTALLPALSVVFTLVIALLPESMIRSTHAAQEPATGITILPADFQLRGPDARQQLLVHEIDSASFDPAAAMGAVVGAAVPSQNVTWATSDPGIVQIVDGVAIPKANGTANLVVEHGGRFATATVTVTEFDQPTPWSFRHDVLPVLSRLGCNSGACHGALAGKGGFRLSLQGYDPLSDHHTITRQARGRRIELADPGASLLLTKPTGAVPHKGGVRLKVDSLDYRILAEWIAAGAPAPADTDPQVTRIEIIPAQTRLPIGSSMQVVVMAHFDDGTVRDVTPWAKLTSTDEAIAKTDPSGKVEVIGPGSGALSAWYSSRVTLGRLLVPYDQTIPASVFAEAPRANFIDELVLERLAALQLPPSPRSTDAEFLRRVHLDTIGRLPTLDETRAFLADTAPDKRQRLIDSLLERDEFVDYWSYKWSDLLLISGTRLRPDAVKAFYSWVRSNVESNVSWDQFARQIVTAKGSATIDGATNFYALHQDPETMTENVSQAFLGLSINCAKCHNHPLEKWTNDQYYAMANLFARVRAKGWGGDPRGGDGQRTVYVVDSGELIQPLRGVPQPPTPLDGSPLDPADPRDRREYLADWLTSADNPYFARAITNRVWANFFGIGLIEPVDDLRASNPASDERLLTALSQHLVEQNFDLKALMRTILRSETYQRSSTVLPENADDRRSFSRYYPRRLMAEVLLDAVSDITMVPTDFNQIEFPGADFAATDFYPKGTRALELYDSAVQSYFLKAFGRNTRDITCECERSNEPSMVQVLHLSNGTTVNGKLAEAGNRIDQLLAAGASDEQIVREAFLLCLCREPDERELASLLATLAEETDERRVRVEDLFWSLMTTREFLFNH